MAMRKSEFSEWEHRLQGTGGAVAGTVERGDTPASAADPDEQRDGPEGILYELAESEVNARDWAMDDADSREAFASNSVDGLEAEATLRAIFDSVEMDDTIGLYFREVGKVALLSAEEEVELAKRMEAGRAAMEVLQESNDLSSEQRNELSTIMEDGLAAREHIIRANTRLVISVANRYVGRGVPLLDLIQEGSIGLIRTADKFDYRRGNRFSTYATWWIRQAVTRAIADQGRTIRLPVHKGDQINKLRWTAHSLVQSTGREPTPDELACALEIPADQVEEIIRIARRPVSLETPIDDDGEVNLGDFLEDDDAQPPDEAAASTVMHEAVHSALGCLPVRELRILQLRFGLLDGQSRTLEQVGQKLGVSRERVRQIEAQALSRLRHPARLRRLKGFLN